MTDEYVVTTRNGKRHEIEADRYARSEIDGGHEFTSPAGGTVWPASHVVCVQRRDGHKLEQLWPVAA